MERQVSAAMAEHFGVLVDPRIEQKTRHKLQDIVTIAVLAAICGADGWVEVQVFGETKCQWLKQFLELPHGIPSHDTFGRVFALLDPEQFRTAFANWMQAVFQVTDGEIVPIDGKTLRRSYDRGSSRAALHVVSAWAAENGAVLGQVATEAKSNEITALPQLIQTLELAGGIVTIDAMGCQTEIARRIREKKADYVLAVKGNQESLHERVRHVFVEYEAHESGGNQFSYHETVERNHGRTERRMCWSVAAPPQIDPQGRWKGLRSIGLVICERTVDGKTTVESRYYISSLQSDAAELARAVRSHWRIENSLHWVLDVVFREDDSRMRIGHSAHNFAIVRHLALNLLKHEHTLKAGTKAKRMKAAMDHDYLLRVLQTAL